MNLDRALRFVNAAAVAVLTVSGLLIVRVFPIAGSSVPQTTVIDAVLQAWPLGRWLWPWPWHVTFLWIFMVTGLLYLASEAITGAIRGWLFTVMDAHGLWPMVRYHFFFGPKPRPIGLYNPLEKLSRTSSVVFGAIAMLTGLVLYKPAQFSTLGWMFGGYHGARTTHFMAMCGMLLFIPGRLILLAMRYWDAFTSTMIGRVRGSSFTPRGPRG